MSAGGKNSNLHAAKRAANDEFFTRLEDIEAEVAHYVGGRGNRNPFRGKTVYLNCDDPFESNFFKYFAMHFNALELKSLIATTYQGSYLTGNRLALDEIAGLQDAIQSGQEIVAYGVEITELEDLNGDGVIDWVDIEELLKTDASAAFPLEGDGDFRSDECVELLKRSDIVVTNPPFSLFREYVAQLIEHEKQFLMIGSKNAITYKEIFPLIKEGRMWIGGRPFAGGMWFEVPAGADFDKIVDGVELKNVPSCWFTNLDHKKRHEELDLVRWYESNEDAYPKYDNYDAIEVSKVKEIPADYTGVMGVPITFLDKHNPDQFEILGISGALAEPLVIEGSRKSGRFYVDGRRLYDRIAIRNLSPSTKFEF